MQEVLMSCGNSIIVFLGAGVIFGSALTVVSIIFLDVLKEKREKKESGKA